MKEEFQGGESDEGVYSSHTGQPVQRHRESQVKKKKQTSGWTIEHRKERKNPLKGKKEQASHEHQYQTVKFILDPRSNKKPLEFTGEGKPGHICTSENSC